MVLFYTYSVLAEHCQIYSVDADNEDSGMQTQNTTNHTEATIDNLNEHRNTNTTTNGLKVKHQCKLHLPPQFRERWERTLENASNNLLEVIFDILDPSWPNE